MKRIICYFKKHTSGGYESVMRFGKGRMLWTVWCKRCGYKIQYPSPHARLVGEEMKFGFDGR